MHLHASDFEPLPQSLAVPTAQPALHRRGDQVATPYAAVHEPGCDLKRSPLSKSKDHCGVGSRTLRGHRRSGDKDPFLD